MYCKQISHFIDEHKLSIDEFILSNNNGLQCRLLNYGARLVSLNFPDKQGRVDDLVLGYDSITGYLVDTPYFGPTIGRCANRIHKGRFEVDGNTYQLPQNEGQTHLHGGLVGFDKVIWQSEITDQPDSTSVTFKYISKDKEEGYPGNLKVAVAYTLTEANQLIIDYKATTDQPTIVDLTNHTYWNLKGAGNGNVLTHHLWVNADKYLPVDSIYIPTGEIEPVEKTPLDFREPCEIGARIDQLERGYAETYCLNKTDKELSFVCTLYEPQSGRKMEISTTESGLIVYTGYFLSDIEGANGAIYNKYDGICLETQNFPNAINYKHFLSPILRPGDSYQQRTIHKFGIV
jgi:aldose 1-epimerase